MSLRSKIDFQETLWGGEVLPVCEWEPILGQWKQMSLSRVVSIVQIEQNHRIHYLDAKFYIVVNQLKLNGADEVGW